MKYSTHELVALNTFLAYWADGLSYGEVIKQLHNGETACRDYRDGIDLAADYEDLDPSHVAQLIEDLHNTLLRTYGKKP